MDMNIIPPQIVTEGGWKENFATEITHYHVASGTQTLCDCTDVPSGGIYVGSHNTHNHKVVIKFNLANFSKEVTTRADFLNLKMLLSCNTVSNPGIAYINGQAIQPYVGERIEVDVSDCYVAGSNELIVEITANEGDGFLGFDKTGQTMPRLLVEYEQSRVNKSTKNIGGLQGVTHSLDLASGEVVTVIEDLKDNSSPIPLSLSHVYKKGSVENGLGSNYMLNIQEKLSKNANGEFIYQDALGDKHTFTEKYYYYADNGDLIDITSDKANIKVESDGTLTYDHYNKIRQVIKQTYSTAGLSVSSLELKGFKNTALLEQRSEEMKTLEETKKDYEGALKQYLIVDKQTGEKVEDKLSTITEDKFNEFKGKLNENKVLLTDAEAIQLKELINQKAQLSDTINSTDIYPNGETGNVNTQIISLESSYKNITNKLKRYVQKIPFESEETSTNEETTGYELYSEGIKNAISTALSSGLFGSAWINLDYINSIANQYDKYCKNNKFISVTENVFEKYYTNDGNELGDEINIYSTQTDVTSEGDKQNSTSITTYIYPEEEEKSNKLGETKKTSETTISDFDKLNAEVSALSLKEMFLQRNLLIRQIEKQEEVIEEQKNTIDKQIEIMLCDQSERVEGLNEYFKEWYNLQVNLTHLNKNMPVNTISNGGITKGFNAEGDLVVLFDKASNAVYIDRDEDGKILKVQTEDKVIFNFDYKGGLLHRVTSANGNSVEYFYSSDNLSLVKYDNGKELSIAYTTDNKIDSIVDKKEILKEQITYDTNGKCSGRKVYGVDTLIDDILDIDITLYPLEYLISETQITWHSETAMSLEDINSAKKETYLLGANKEIIEYYLEEDGLLVQAERYTQLTYGGKKTEYAHKNNLRITEFDYRSYSFGTTDYEQIENTWFFKPEKITTRKILTDTKQITTLTEFTYNENEECILERLQETKQFNGEQTITVFVTKHTYNLIGLEIKTENYVEGEESINGTDVEEFVYNEKGRLLYTCKYNLLDPSSKYYTQVEYDDKGREVAEYDSTGKHKTVYEYRGNSEEVENTVYPNGSKVSRFNNGNVSTVTQSTEVGEENSNVTYTKYGLPVKVKSGEQEISYAYTTDRELHSVDFMDRGSFLSYSYVKNDTTAIEGVKCDTVSVTHAQGDVFEIRTDKHGNLRGKYFNGMAIAGYTYDDRREKLIACTNGQSHTFEYDAEDRLTSHIIGDVIKNELTYNSKGQLSNKKYYFKPVSQSYMSWDSVTDIVNYGYGYSEDSKQRLLTVTTDNMTEWYSYDMLGRLKTTKQSMIGIDTREKQYSYYKNGDKATNLVNSISYYTGDILTDKEYYTYDSMGNIISVSKNGAQVKAYTYDSLNRLIKEKNIDTDIEIWYTYDRYGNISTKTVNGEEIRYVYDKAGIKLLSYGDQSYSYDNLNNPINLNATYYTLTWSKNQLASARAASHVVSFTYDADGLLLTRSIGGQNEKFFYEEGRLIRRLENYTTATDFLYGQEGLIGFTYNGEKYLYEKNLLGDIVKIIDSTGAIVGEYSYTAFGECTIVTNINNIASINPFRYRGYYLESNTGLYYLKSRFYNPVTGRFISQDSLKYLQPDTINGLNLFAYCYNNPTIHVDPSGHSAILVIGLLVGSFIVGSGASVVSQGLTYGWDKINYWQAGVDGLFALGSTALAMTGIGVLASAGIGAVAGWSQYAIGSAFHGEDLTLWGSITAAGLGFIGGAISGAGARNGSNIASNMRLTGKGASAVKAITTASNRYLAGEISMKGLQATTRLWGNVALNAVQEAIAPTITKLMLKGSLTIAGWTVVSAGITYGLSYVY